jgi:hypothetical protein
MVLISWAFQWLFAFSQRDDVRWDQNPLVSSYTAFIDTAFNQKSETFQLRHVGTIGLPSPSRGA